MKSKIFIALALLIIAFYALPSLSAQIPTKLFDVRNGNGSVLSSVTYPDATIIVYKAGADKTNLIQAVCDARGYQANIPDPANPGQTIPNPQSKQAFFNDALKQFLKDNYRSTKSTQAANTAAATAQAAADAELP